MGNLCLSVRITDKYFTSEEISKVNEELESYSNKSEFLRNAIKEYLNIEQDINKDKHNLKKQDQTNNCDSLQELIEENNKILKILQAEGIKFNYENNEDIYEGNQQEVQTEKVLNLLNQF